MAVGKVKWFNDGKGWGFIKQATRAVEVVDVEARHLVLVFVIEGRARRPYREELSRARAERPLEALVEVPMQQQPADDMVDRVDEVAGVAEPFDPRLRARRWIVD